MYIKFNEITIKNFQAIKSTKLDLDNQGIVLVKGINESIKKYDLPFVCYNVGSICQLHTVATMHFRINWKKPWEIPYAFKQTGIRQTEMQYMGAAYMAEGLVTLAGSRLYTSSAYTEEDIDECIRRFDKVLSKCEKIDY